jgi:hypothetical protein
VVAVVQMQCRYDSRSGTIIVDAIAVVVAAAVSGANGGG